MKNILAENMLRFGPKNLSESEKKNLTDLTEQDTATVDRVVNKKFILDNVTIDGKTGELQVFNPRVNTNDSWRVADMTNHVSKTTQQPYVALQLTTYQEASNQDTNLAKLGLLIYKNDIRIWPKYTQYPADNAKLVIGKEVISELPRITQQYSDPNTYKNVSRIKQIQTSL